MKKEEAIKNELYYRIQYLIKETINEVPKSKQKRVKENLEIEINNLLNIALQNKDYYIYSEYKEK